jgi:hypothetical protein
VSDAAALRIRLNAYRHLEDRLRVGAIRLAAVEVELLLADCRAQIEAPQRQAAPALSAVPGFVIVQRPGGEPVRVPFKHECATVAAAIIASPAGMPLQDGQANILRKGRERLALALERRGLPECVEAAALVRRIVVSESKGCAFLRPAA